MTMEFHNSAAAIPASPAFQQRPAAFFGESTQAARVIDALTEKLQTFHQNASNVGVAKHVDIDIRPYALSDASITSVLKAFRDKGYEAGQGGERHPGGYVFIRVSW
jgi:hypothetical protein